MTFVRLFRNDWGKAGLLKSAKFLFEDVNGDPIVRVHVYKPIWEEGRWKPGALLFSSSPLQLTNRRSRLTYEFVAESVEFPIEGAFVGIEVVRGGRSKNPITKTVSDNALRFCFTARESEAQTWGCYQDKRWALQEGQPLLRSPNPGNLQAQLEVMY